MIKYYIIIIIYYNIIYYIYKIIYISYKLIIKISLSVVIHHISTTTTLKYWYTLINLPQLISLHNVSVHIYYHIYI